MELLSNVSTHASTTDHSSQKIPSAPSSNRAYGFPIHGFPMFFLQKHASVISQEPNSDLAFRESFLCSVLIVRGVDSAMAIPGSSTRRKREQSRVPSLGPGCVVPGPPTVLCTPPTPTTARSDFGLPYTPRLLALRQHRRGPPVLHSVSSATCHPCYPGRSWGWMFVRFPQTAAFPF